jgi:hypothetical protein
MALVMKKQWATRERVVPSRSTCGSTSRGAVRGEDRMRWWRLAVIRLAEPSASAAVCWR